MGFMFFKKGTFVRIRQYVLMPEERAENIPDDTKKVPLKMWVKGRLKHDAEQFEEADIVTASGRTVSGTFKEVEPKYKHTFGDHVEPILQMREIIKKERWGDDV